MATILTAASFAVSATSAVIGYQQQNMAAKNQTLAYNINKDNARKAFEDKNNDISVRQTQEQEAASAEKFDVALDANKARATARVAAGEAGISGLSVDQLLRDFSGRQARHNDRVDQNTDWTITQLQQEKKGLGYQYKDRVNAVPTGQKPSFADAGLRIAAAGLNSVSTYKKFSS
ncbi:hypothetical protein [Bosea sp. LC85]|uniref:virion core protein, T7 gp14 family n=1 Tax=Bosea sp. LC85 TaxID=1502851 RepID=UPI0005B7DA64|nr:hypothetical protein [Bosea sp. LC85]